MREIASESLQCMELVSNSASHELEAVSGVKPTTFADINSFTDINLMKNLAKMKEVRDRALHV